MRILFYTNVLIASLISNGFCRELLENSFIEHDLITSEFILAELKEKLVKKFNFSQKPLAKSLNFLEAGSKWSKQ